MKTEVTTTHFLYRWQQLGGHIHVDVFAGTALEAENQSRTNLGRLIMDPDHWDAMQIALHGLPNSHPLYRVDIREAEVVTDA